MRLPFFYGWIIVAVTFVTMAIGVNARTSFSLFFPPIIDEFGWERGVTAGAFSFGFLVSGGRQPADRPHDGSLRSARRDGARRRADGGRPVAGAADDAAMASLSDHRRHGRRRQRLSRLFRSIAVSAELVQSPARPCDGACLRRRRHRLGHPAAVGAAHDRADRLANRLHRDGHSGSGRAGADQPVAAQAAARTSGFCRTATRRRRHHPPSRYRISSIPNGPASTGPCSARFAPRGSGGSRSAISADCTSGTRCRFTRPNICSTSASARTSRSGRWARSACSAFPARSCSAISPTGSGANGYGPRAALALRSALRR